MQLSRSVIKTNVHIYFMMVTNTLVITQTRPFDDVPKHVQLLRFLYIYSCMRAFTFLFNVIFIYVVFNVFAGAQTLALCERWIPWGRCLHVLWGSCLFFVSLSVTPGFCDASRAHLELDDIFLVLSFVPFGFELVGLHSRITEGCPESVLNAEVVIWRKKEKNAKTLIILCLPMIP